MKNVVTCEPHRRHSHGSWNLTCIAWRGGSVQWKVCNQTTLQAYKYAHALLHTHNRLFHTALSLWASGLLQPGTAASQRSAPGQRFGSLRCSDPHPSLPSRAEETWTCRQQLRRLGWRALMTYRGPAGPPVCTGCWSKVTRKRCTYCRYWKRI